MNSDPEVPKCQILWSSPTIFTLAQSQIAPSCSLRIHSSLTRIISTVPDDFVFPFSRGVTIPPSFIYSTKFLFGGGRGFFCFMENWVGLCRKPRGYRLPRSPVSEREADPVSKVGGEVVNLVCVCLSFLFRILVLGVLLWGWRIALRCLGNVLTRTRFEVMLHVDRFNKTIKKWHMQPYWIVTERLVVLLQFSILTHQLYRLYQFDIFNGNLKVNLVVKL